MKQLQDKPFWIASVLLLIMLTLLYQTGQAYAQQEGGDFLAGVPADFPPHYSIDYKTGKPVGFAIDVMDEVARRSGIKVKYVVYPTWAKTLGAMEKGEIVLIPNLGISAEREAYIDFTPSIETALIVVFVRDTTTDIKGVEDLKGKEVAVVEMSKGLFLMQERGGSRLQSYASQDEAFLSLISGNSDALVFAEPPITLLSRKAGLEGRIKIVGKPLFEVKRGIAVRKGNPELLKKLDDEVKTFIKTPRYAEIFTKWYSKPGSYWTARRVAFLGGGLLAFAIVTLVVWRYLSLLRLNKELQAVLTERKKAEESLRESESHMQCILGSTADGILAIDNHGKVIKANQRFAEIWRIPQPLLDAGDDKALLNFVLEQLSEPEAFLKKVQLLYGTTKEDMDTLVFKDGRVFERYSTPMMMAGSVMGRLWSFRDITERKKAEEKLQKSEVLIRNILESVDEGFIIIDRDFRIIMANRAFAKEAGMPVEDIIGKHCYEVSHNFPKPCYEAGQDCAVRRVFETGTPYTAIHTHYDSKGEPVYTETKAYPLSKDESGKIMTVIEILVDITGKTKLEDQLRQSQKMEAVGQIAGGIAHDFNNILTAIIGYASLTQMKLKEDDPLRHNIDQVLASAERAANLTQGLLAFSRKQINNPAPVNLNELIKKVEKFLRRVIGEDIELKSILSERELTVMADHGQIDQALMNLATNARDAMPMGGSLTIEIGTIEIGTMEIDEGYIKAHGYGKTGIYALISVTDSGIGMDKKTREKIFEPFFTTKEVGKGTGLGLSIVYGIVKQHGGYINCYSELGKGTTFRIYLPLIKTEEVKDIKPAEPEKPVTGTETILLAEDEENVRELTRIVLEEYGYKVIEAIDGEDAVNKFMENKYRIDLLLFDLIMPKMSGKEAFDRIRKIMPDIKVLFASGYPADFIHREEITEQGLSFVSKPISPTALIKKVREALDK